MMLVGVSVFHYIAVTVTAQARQPCSFQNPCDLNGISEDQMRRYLFSFPNGYEKEGGEDVPPNWVRIDVGTEYPNMGTPDDEIMYIGHPDDCKVINPETRLREKRNCIEVIMEWRDIATVNGRPFCDP